MRSLWILAMVMQTMGGQSYTPVLTDPMEKVECEELLSSVLPIKKYLGVVSARCIEVKIKGDN